MWECSEDVELEVVNVKLLILALLTTIKQLIGKGATLVSLALLKGLVHPDSGTVTIE